MSEVKLKASFAQTTGESGSTASDTVAIYTDYDVDGDGRNDRIEIHCVRDIELYVGWPRIISNLWNGTSGYPYAGTYDLSVTVENADGDEIASLEQSTPWQEYTEQEVHLDASQFYFRGAFLATSQKTGRQFLRVSSNIFGDQRLEMSQAE